MKESRWRRLFRREIDKETQGVLKKVNSNSKVKDAEAPHIIHARVKDQAYSDNRLTAEERELIRLGQRYRRKRSRTKYVAVAAVAIFALALGMTVTGAGERTMERVQWWIAGRIQINLDSNDGKIQGQDIVSEDEAYEKIEEVFGVYPVKRTYLPQYMVFREAHIEEELQNARIYYTKGQEKVLCMSVWFPHRSSSIGIDLEEGVLKRTEMEVQGTIIYLTQYDSSDGKTRCRAEFEYQKVYYSAMMTGFTDQEIENFVKNLKFF